MPTKAPSNLARFLAICLVILGGARGEAQAANFTWTSTSICLFGPCNWSSSSFWSPAGYPSAGDRATIARNTAVTLTESIGSLTGLSLSNGVRLSTNGHALNATSSNATTDIEGNGTTCASTRLTVDSGAPLGFDYFGSFLSMRRGAELRMNGGGAVTTFGIYLSPSSLISGHGTVALLNSGNTFNVAGTIRPSGGDLLIWSQASGGIDLDGDITGDESGNLDVTSTGNLEVRGDLSDPFSGTMTVGHSNDIEFDTPFSIDGSVRFTATSDSHLISPWVTFRSDAEVIVDNAIAYIDAQTSWPFSPRIELIATTDELHLTDDATFGDSTEWAGRGLLVNETSAVMSLADGSDVGVDLLNEGSLSVGHSTNDETGFVSLSDLEQSGGLLSFDIEGKTAGVDYDQIHVNGNLVLDGDLEILLPPGFDIVQGDAFALITVDGTTTGSFSGLGDGDLVGTFDGEDLYLTYAGGDGNDVVLYTLPEPGMAMGIALGALSLAGRQHRGNRASQTT